jgi:hypothetical protein
VEDLPGMDTATNMKEWLRLTDAQAQWLVVPFGAGVGKLVHLGKLPVNVNAQGYYNAVRPDVGPEWQLRVAAVVLLPTSIF